MFDLYSSFCSNRGLRKLNLVFMFLILALGITHVIIYQNVSAVGDGGVSSTIEINQDTPNISDLVDYASFGTSIANIGDLNNDGIDDIAVGAPSDDTAGSDRGAIHIMLMNDDGTVSDTIKINEATPNGPVLNNSDSFGTSIANIGDLNNDGINDIAVGAPHTQTDIHYSGAIHILFMNNDGTVSDTIEINPNTPNGPVLNNSDSFGTSIANIGDLNNDGINDIAVGAPSDDTAGPDRGAIHILFMNNDGTVSDTIEINSNTTNGPVLNNSDSFGTSIANIGDLNNDGINDIAVGAPSDDTAGPDRGAIHILFMNNDGTVSDTIEINSNTTNGPVLNNSDSFGTSIANIGDLNGNGIDDIAVGTPFTHTDILFTGAIHIMLMNDDGTVSDTIEINDNTPNGPVLNNSDFFGTSIANIGDLNNDGINDIAVGAAGSNYHPDGAIHVMFMYYSEISPALTFNDNTPNGPNLKNNDHFGTSTADIGDLNGDGISDIVVGAPGDSAGGDKRGAIHVMFMNRDRTISSTIEINSNTLNGPILKNNDHFGTSTADIGDLNGDGISDIAVGAPGDNAGGPDRGTIHVMVMNRDGTISSTIEINSNTPNGPNLKNNDYFGYSIANIGDLNGDGISDIAVGAPFDDTGDTSQGSVHILFMSYNGTVSDAIEINSNTPNGPVLTSYDYFGSSIANIGDLNGDGISDIAVGAPGDNAGGPDRGAIHIMLMNNDGTVSDTIEINDIALNGPILNNKDSFGSSIANIGDLNGDGISDIAVGAPGDNAGGPDRGTIHVMVMNRDGAISSTIEINSNTPNVLDLKDNDDFGTSITNIGDWNGDGISDIAIGAIGHFNTNNNRGAIHVIFLYSNVGISSTIEINSNTPNGPDLKNNDFFGHSIADIGDLNGDGISDIAVGAPGDRGALHIMLMKRDGTISSTIEINSNTTNGPVLNNFDFFGQSTANIGDLNGDGISDIAVGAPRDSAGGSNRGALHIMLMNDDGTVSDTIKINEDTPNGPDLKNNDFFGQSTANIGDLNGDGISDIAVGAPGDSAGGPDRGTIHVMVMNRDGTISSTIEINSNTPNGPNLKNNDYFGYSIANIGDLNGDGISDIAVGSKDSIGGPGRGAIHIMLMNNDGTVSDTIEINSNTPNGPVLNDFDHFGDSIANIGDLNGDGISDIAVGAFEGDPSGFRRGVIHILFMNNDGTVSDAIEINSNTPNGPVLNAGYFRQSITNIGDLNNDGINDIAVGTPGDSAGGSNRGTIHILIMKSTNLIPPVIIPVSDVNLLNDPYSLSSWTIHSKGGNGWLDSSSNKKNWVPSEQAFATSYGWAEKSQLVPILSTYGKLILTEDYSKTYCGEKRGVPKNNPPYDRYYLALLLLDRSGNEIERHVTGQIKMKDSCNWSRNWHTAEIVVDSIPKDTVSALVKHGGISAERWAGWYGPVMKDIKLVHQN